MTLDIGGIETYLYRFLKYIGNEIEAFVICKNGYKEWSLLKKIEETGARVIGCDVGVKPSLKYTQFYSFLKKNEVDAIVDFTGDFSGFVMLISRLAKIPIRLTFYRESRYQFALTFFKKIYVSILHKLVVNNTTRILSNSLAALNYFCKGENIEGEQYKVIHNGINIDLFLKEKLNLREQLGIPKSAIVIGNVGRFTPAKNHMTMLDVAVEVCQQYHNVYFLFCGKGVSALPIKEELVDRVILIEHESNIKLVYNTLDLFLFLSTNEGLPNVLIEAMLSKLPIVASNIESNREVFPKFFHKYLCNPIDIEEVCSRVNYYMESYKNKRTEELENQMFKFVCSKFDSNVLFQSFKNELL